jgi:hypothetical protein
VLMNETGTSEVGIAVTVKAPPARKARGVRVPKGNAPKKRVALSADSSESSAARSDAGTTVGTSTEADERRIASSPSPYGFRQRELHWVSSAPHRPTWCTTPPVPATNEAGWFREVLTSELDSDDSPRIGSVIRKDK